MTIQVTCGGCFRTYGVKDEYAGRKIKCPDCSAPVQIPDGRAAATDDFGGFGGDDDFGGPGPGAAPPRSRSQTTSASSRTQSGGSSFPVIGVVLGVGGLLFLLLCGGIVGLAIHFGGGGGGGVGAAAFEGDDELDQALAGRQIGGTRQESGRLGFTDATLDSGEYFDEYTISANTGDVYVIDLYSQDFDPYLMVLDESESSEFQIENDDFGGTHHSQVVLTAPANSTYLVVATTFEPGETGAYELTIREVQPDAVGGEVREETGALAPGDQQLDISAGEYVDVYTLDAEQGEMYVIDLHSNEFDTYLLVTGPGEVSIENDDYDGSTSRSQITLLAPSTGQYEINVTSYDAGETGSYRLTIEQR